MKGNKIDSDNISIIMKKAINYFNANFRYLTSNARCEKANIKVKTMCCVLILPSNFKVFTQF